MMLPDVETRRLVSGRSSAADSASRFRTLTQVHCSRKRNAACSGPDHRHAVDLRIGNLFDRSTISTEDGQLAAIELSRNLTAPVVHDPLPLASAETDQERRRILTGRSADARTALASDYFAHARALRAPAVELGAWAAAIVPRETGESPVSRLELIEILASRRFEDPGWFVHLQSMDQSALLREVVTLQAISLILDWERFRLDERRGAIDAADLAIANERRRMLQGPGNPGSGAN